MAQSLPVSFTNTISHSCRQEELSPRQRLVIKAQKKTSPANLPDGRSPTLARCCNTPQRKLCKTHKEVSDRVELYFLPRLIHFVTNVKETRRTLGRNGTPAVRARERDRVVILEQPGTYLVSSEHTHEHLTLRLMEAIVNAELFFTQNCHPR